MEIRADIYSGDSKEILKSLTENSVDLIVTSPPYADQRKQTYGGIDPDNYVEWFLPISEQLLRVLKPTGTFILNIKEKVVNGERSTYVMELILKMRKQGWLWTEEFIWHKKNSYPGKWPNRFRDAWERLLQFNKNRKFNMYQDFKTTTSFCAPCAPYTRLCSMSAVFDGPEINKPKPIEFRSILLYASCIS